MSHLGAQDSHTMVNSCLVPSIYLLSIEQLDDPNHRYDKDVGAKQSESTHKAIDKWKNHECKEWVVEVGDLDMRTFNQPIKHVFEIPYSQ